MIILEKREHSNMTECLSNKNVVDGDTFYKDLYIFWSVKAPITAGLDDINKIQTY